MDWKLSVENIIMIHDLAYKSSNFNKLCVSLKERFLNENLYGLDEVDLNRREKMSALRL